MSPRILAAAALVVLAPLSAACSSIGGSAIRTGPLRLPQHVGAVALYSAGETVAGQDVGILEVHAAQSEATIETLLPLFVQKAAQIGANAAIIDSVQARFQIITTPHVETYTYQCGKGAMCTGSRMYASNDEVMMVSITGRAVAISGASPPAPPTEVAP